MRSLLQLGLIVTAAVTSLAGAPVPGRRAAPAAGPTASALADPAPRLVVFEEFSRPT